jgi:hypothetical protein
MSVKGGIGNVEKHGHYFYSSYVDINIGDDVS